MQRTRAIRRSFAVVVACASFAAASPASAHDLTIDTSAAHAVLDALANPNLTPAEAHRIAEMPPNREIVRKVASFGSGATEALFERELLAAARGETLANERFYFGNVKKKLPDVIATLDEFERKRDENVGYILDRVARFSPPGPPLHLKGWIIAGGSSTGFAFGGPEFYLRISDFIAAPDYLRAIMAHELYHSVRGAALTTANKKVEYSSDGWRRLHSKHARDAYAVRSILTSVFDEGLASYVGDAAQTTSTNRKAANERGRILDAADNPGRLPALLEMTLRSVTDKQPLDLDDAYAVGFLADQPLYYLGYGMAKAIAEKEGDARLGELALGDGCGFANEYLKLTRSDSELPKLGARTTALIGSACP